MNASEIPVALLAGFLSFLAPCVLPLVPGYLSAVSAVEADELGRPGTARRVVVSSIPFGWLVRDLHAWAASLVVVLVILHLLRTLAEGAYKAPRQTNWTMGLLLLVVVIAFGSSGYLLPWDQGSYWTVTEALDAISRVPILGGLVAELLQGDEAVSGATLSRFFALHVIILPWLLLGLIVLPVLWWLLRLLPPAPRRLRFPAITLLFGLQPREETPDRTPPSMCMWPRPAMSAHDQ